MSVYNRVFKCGICGEPVADGSEQHFHKGCVIDEIYETYLRFEKPSKSLLQKASRYGVSAVEIRNTVMQDACGRLRND